LTPPDESRAIGSPDSSDPIAEFRRVLGRASHDAPFDATAVALATVGADGAAAVRMVLLKGFDERGFRFFTNYESRKGRELAREPRAALCFFWPWIEEQVRIEGAVEKLSPADSDAYFATRSRASQLGAWASRQSEPMQSRFSLLRRFALLEARWLGRPVPRPLHWGGFLLRPSAIEFWTGKRSRLHDRRRYTLGDAGWTRERLQP